MATDAQSQIAALRDDLARLHKQLADQGTDTYKGLNRRARHAFRAARPAVSNAADYVRSEGTAVADTARSHPAALSAIVVTSALAGLAVGFLLASATSEPPRRRYW
ncbi:hypothetical protein [Sinorhizobium sp. BG8]|uniref:hypothetical protein n=1 Tax=Sinorhizobium sp. BG8 TaxID=2613773 RepID=UPI00193E165E|nr:hypothetical protein [Sinorhizobium sp. BG8]QRM53860.1 hypothetical protein F3Y30_04280 [Sinorhizobium sp. BG8]